MVAEAPQKLAAEDSVTRPQILRDENGRLLPGQSALNPYGRPKKRESYQELAAALPTAKKVKVLDAQYKQAVVRGSTRAAEFLRDTAEGKPATRIIVETSASYEDVSSKWAEIDAEFAVVNQIAEASK